MSEHDRNARVLSREVVYENPYQRVYRVDLELGADRKEIFVTDYGYRVGVVVEGPAGILLTRQYRHLIDRVSFEIPGGKADEGEPLEQAARRECLEETGIMCGELQSLLMFHPGLDTLHNPTQLFHASSYEDRQDVQPRHDGEVCGREWIPLEECLSMISTGTIVDSLSIIALLSYSVLRKEK